VILAVKKIGFNQCLVYAENSLFQYILRLSGLCISAVSKNVFYRDSAAKAATGIQASLQGWQVFRRFARLTHTVMLCHAKWTVLVTARF